MIKRYKIDEINIQSEASNSDLVEQEESEEEDGPQILFKNPLNKEQNIKKKKTHLSDAEVNLQFQYNRLLKINSHKHLLVKMS